MTTIDLNRVATFVRVVELGGFTPAAAALGVPTSSISRSVSRLEEDLGVRLLHRTTRKMSATPAGRQLFDRLRPVISAMHEATDGVADQAAALRGPVRVTAPVGLSVLPRLLARLLQQHPGLEVDLLVTNRYVDLVEEGVDLAIRAGQLEDSTLVARRIASSDLGVFGAPAYLARRGQPRTPAELAQHACLVLRGRGGSVGWRLTGPRRTETVHVRGPLSTDDMPTLVEATRAGLGLSLLPLTQVREMVEAGELVRVLPKHALRGGAIQLVWPSRRFTPARVTLVRDHLFTALTEMITHGE